MRVGGVGCSKAACAVLVVAAGFCHAAAPPRPVCVRLEIEGAVAAGQEWKTPLGEGWVFRVLPIAPTSAAYSGWDMVVDRDPPSGYPDALLLATLPYNSINQREIGTTFDLRAQDAIGWNPRSFRFLSNPAEFREAQQRFRQLTPADSAHGTNVNPGASKAAADTATMQRLLHFESRASSGQLRILDARIVRGIADPKPFALNWALASSRTPHEIEPAAAGQASAQGKLLWMRFALTLWLPASWKAGRELRASRVLCPE